ncbi:hypothetical protein [Herbaspirillum sp. alder98]|uniref:hypothetical protein n=1 Tax=Herbaspirillum sp. alder98 TaxID=2913096 RepID=UPI001CD8B209|nr:hypothetical protein [Herbaspirillum sp. alder98]MCA1324788.1 hypothetical protein [Herbaspirillum sp. alder98]
MSKKIISVALLAAAAFSTGAYAQSYQGGNDSSSPQQYQDSSSTAQYYDYQGNQSSSPSNYQEQNGQYIDHTGRDTGSNKANPYAREMKDGPMGTSPGA